jgi:hypothetical protein
MSYAFRVGLGLFLTVCGPVWAQKANTTDPTIQFDHSRWKLIKKMRATFDPLPDPVDILLLESLKPTGAGGLGQPLNDVELLIESRRTIFMTT